MPFLIRPQSVLAGLGLMMTLAACAGGPASGGGPAPILPTARYALQVETDMDRIALAVRADDLSHAQDAALQALALRFQAEGADQITIEAPYGGDIDADATALRVRRALEHAGVPGHLIRTAVYDGPDARAPVLAGFPVHRAVVHPCGRQWGSLGRTGDNQPSANFGCAVTANLAAQIADPRDIVRPRPMTPVDAGRRAVVFANYRTGEATAAPREELVAGRRVSRAVD